ncbi:hypothetical protein FB45DRAFT_933635 [Roridomyces roridus]|uniref:F-box domain-containing protein n=1 Tax=Roridomyces roridus TaxID=1738132 RepID=A0AAD7FFF7_9AGAR|nr:hypothetical protein FB45DRAFT_933635 [Roridomyces roridus]
MSLALTQTEANLRARMDRYRELLRSNSDAPSDIRSTISALSTDLSRCDEGLARLHTELARLQAQLNCLTAERQTLQIHYDDCHALLAPIRRLPSEILGSIFDLCRYPDEDDEDEDNRSGPILGHHKLAQRLLRAISRVCIHWRRIVIGTPAYWNTIKIGEGFTIKTPRDLKLLTVALERSRSSPLHVKIYNDQLAFRLLTEFSERWQTAELHFGARDCTLFLRLANRLPMLQKLCIRAFPLQLAPRRALGDFIESAPCLRNLIIAAPLMPTGNEALLRQLSSLTFTSVYPTYITGCVVLISGLSASAQLALFLEDRMPTLLRQVTGPDPPISIPPTTSSLSTFRIRFDSVAHLKEIFTALTLPGLVTLSLRGKYPNLPWPHAEFHALAARSRFHDHLLTLDLRATYIAQAELLECLGALPCLERLTIGDRADRHGQAHHCVITDGLLQGLTVTAAEDGRSQCPAPRLLRLRLFTLGKFDDTVYFNFLRSRMDHLALSNPQQLFESQIEWLWDCERQVGESVMEQIDELCKSGCLKFSIITDEDEWDKYWALRDGDFDSDSEEAE